MKKIMFICTGNTCRSPMAEGLFRELLKVRKIKKVKCESAGTHAYAGDEAEPNAVAAAKELGADISKHRSRSYNPYIVDDADLFVCMTPAHAAQLSGVPAEKIVILANGIPDPYGGDLAEYRRCAKMIAAGLEDLIKVLEDEKNIKPRRK